MLAGTASSLFIDGFTVIRNTGNLFLNATSNLIFYTNDNERMRIDSSGNVGIGTSSPVNTLEVSGNFTVTDTNSTIGNFSIVMYNSSCSGFRFGSTGGLLLSCE